MLFRKKAYELLVTGTRPKQSITLVAALRQSSNCFSYLKCFYQSIVCPMSEQHVSDRRRDGRCVPLYSCSTFLLGNLLPDARDVCNVYSLSLDRSISYYILHTSMHFTSETVLSFDRVLNCSLLGARVRYRSFHLHAGTNIKNNKPFCIKAEFS